MKLFLLLAIFLVCASVATASPALNSLSRKGGLKDEGTDNGSNGSTDEDPGTVEGSSTSEEPGTSEEPDTDEDKEVQPNIIAKNETNAICLLANIDDVNITIKYSAKDDKMNTVNFTLKAMEPESISTCEQVEYTLGESTVIAKFEKNDSIAKFTSMDFSINTADETFFPDSTGAVLKSSVLVDISVPLEESFQCSKSQNSNAKIYKSNDENISFQFNQIGFQLGGDLTKEEFGEGQTCGAAGLSLALLAITASLLSTSLRLLA